MALLSISERTRILEAEGFKNNKTGIKAFQKKYMKRKSDWDGIWGTNTDNTARTVDNVKRYTKNFKPSEFACDCNGRYCCGYPSYMKMHELTLIQDIRDHYGKPIIITCGLRCKRYNNQLNGSLKNTSKHLTGQAIDFYQKGVTDTLANRKRSLKWIQTRPFFTYGYGDGINAPQGYKVRAKYMGNALHVDTK